MSCTTSPSSCLLPSLLPTLPSDTLQAANFIGIPALTVPVAVVPSTHSQGGATGAPMLPVGLQIMAPCFHEASLLHVGAVLEKAVEAAGSGVPLPPVWYDVLKQRSASGSGGSC